MNPTISILVGTRVKKAKATQVRNKFGPRWFYLDNYSNHNNGRIWIMWDSNKVKVKMECSSAEFLHCGIYNMDGEFSRWCTTIYDFNTLKMSKTLWQKIENLQTSINEHWFLMGDFNNVLQTHDRIGGSMVQEAEFRDLVKMMKRIELHDKDSIREHSTWLSNQVDGPIYSKIDKVIANLK